ncbi:hypothetical protein Ancab_030453 [Ancistrocladus abbreviatus]
MISLTANSALACTNASAKDPQNSIPSMSPDSGVVADCPSLHSSDDFTGPCKEHIHNVESIETKPIPGSSKFGGDNVDPTTIR